MNWRPGSSSTNMSYWSLIIYSLRDTDTPSRMSLYQKQWYFSTYHKAWEITYQLGNSSLDLQEAQRGNLTVPIPSKKKWCDLLKLAATYSPIRKALLRIVGPQGKLPGNLYFHSHVGRRWLLPGCSAPLVTSRSYSNVRVAKFVPEWVQGVHWAPRTSWPQGRLNERAH